MPTALGRRGSSSLSSPDRVSLILTSRTVAMLWRMSDDRIAELERRLAMGVAAFNRGDLDGAHENMAAGCRYQIQRDHPESRVCVGPDEIREYQRGWFDQMDEIHYEISGTDVRWPFALVSGRITGRGTGSGVKLDVDLTMLYELDDDVRAVYAEELLDPAEARRRFDSIAASQATE